MMVSFLVIHFSSAIGKQSYHEETNAQNHTGSGDCRSLRNTDDITKHYATGLSVYGGTVSRGGSADCFGDIQ